MGPIPHSALLPVQKVTKEGKAIIPEQILGEDYDADGIFSDGLIDDTSYRKDSFQTEREIAEVIEGNLLKKAENNIISNKIQNSPKIKKGGKSPKQKKKDEGVRESMINIPQTQERVYNEEYIMN